MSLVKNKKISKCCAIAACFLVISWLAVAGAAQSDPKGLREQAFTGSSSQVDMPAEWIKTPITREPGAPGMDISIVMDQDIYHTLRPLIGKYAKEHNLKIALKEGTCGIVAGMLGRKTTDIGGFCCPPGKEDRLPGLKYHSLGIVAKAILVHPGNPVDSLSEEEVRHIFRGKIINWSQVKTSSGSAGQDRPIQAIGRFHCKLRPGHWKLILPDEKMFGPMVVEVGSIPDMITQVGSQPDAIGWEVLSMVAHYADLKKVKPLKINGKLPTDKEAIAARTYPFYRTYNVTTWEGKEVANPKAQALVEYLLREVENLDLKFGFVSSKRLRAEGWQFKENELIGEPL